MAWLDDYKAHLDSIVAAKSNAVQFTGSSQLSNAYALLASVKSSPRVYGAGLPGSGGPTSSKGLSFGGAWNATKSGGLKLLDFMSRPGGAFANAALAANQDKKSHHETLQKLATFVPIVGTYAGELVKGDVSDEASAFWKGLKGEEHTTYSDVLRAKGVTGKTASFGGFAADVAFDPLNYVGAGTFRAIGRGGKVVSQIGKGEKTAVGAQAAEIALEKPSVRAATELMTNGTTKPDRATGNDLLEFVLRQRERASTSGELSKIADVPRDTTMFERPKGEQGATVVPKPEPAGAVDNAGSEFKFDFEKPAIPKQTADEAALIAARSATESASNILTKVPTRRYKPGTTIRPAFIEESAQEVNVKPPKVAEVAPTETAAPTPKAAPAKKMESARARALAMKQHILSTPNYQMSVTAGGRPVKTSIANLRQMAERDPSKAKMIDSMINQEASRLAKESPEYFGNTPTINLSGRTGTGRAAISVDDFQRLLETGEVPRPVGETQAKTRDFYTADAERLRGESPLDKFAVHHAEDLANLHVSDITGKREPLSGYLKRAGVKVQAINPLKGGTPQEALEGLSNKITPESAVSSQNKIQSAEGGASGQIRARYRPLSKSERAAWIKDHETILDEEDRKFLLSTKISAKDAGAWTKAVDQVLNKVVPTAYDNVDDLMKALDEGRVSADDLADLQRIVGAKTPKGIKRGLQNLLKKTVELEKKVSEARTAKVDTSVWETPLPEVKPAEQIVEDVVQKGDVTDLTDVKATLDASQVQDLKAGMGHLVQREIIDPQTAAKYGFVSRGGTKRTHGTMNKGLGRNLDEWNKYSQLSVVSGIIKFRTDEVQKTITAAGIKGPAAKAARMRAMYDHVMPIMRTTDKILRENGIPPFLSKNPRYAASLTDVLDAMPREFVEKHFFSMLKDGEHIPPTFWNDAEEVVQDYAHGVLDFDTAIHAVRDVLLEKQTTRAGKQIFTGVRSQYYKIRGADSEDAAEEYVLKVAREFMLTAGPIKQTIEKNIADVVVHDTNGAAKVSKQAMESITNLVTSPGFAAHDLLRVANERDTIVESVAKSAGVTSTRAKEIARSDVEVQSAAIIPPEVAANAHDAKKVAEANQVPTGWSSKDIDRGWAKTSQTAPPQVKIEIHKTPKGREVVRTQKVKLVNAISDSLDDTEVAVKQIMDTGGESLSDIGAAAERVMGWAVLKAFAPHLGNADVRPMFLTRNSFAQTVGRSYSAQLSRIARSHSGDDINAAWKELQNGTRPGVESVGAAHADLEKAVRSLFNDDDTYNMIRSSGITPEQINGHFKKFGIHDKYRLTDDYLNDWKKWQTDNPLDLLSRFQAATMASRTERVLGADLSRRFGSKTPTPGSVRITSSKSILGRYLDPSAYFPRDIAEQMSVLDQAMKQMGESTTSNKAVSFYDNVLHAYKSGLTIYRPGHHIRNMVGDMWLSWMDGVNNPSVYKKALMVMADNKGRYDDFDSLQALAAAGENNAKRNRIVASTMVGGKKVDLTTGEVYQLAYKNGILPDYRTLEDIQFGGAANPMESLGRLGRPFKGKLHEAASSLSESRDHYVRIAHFIDVLGKSRGGSIDNIAEAAANRVRKWHPDGSDLTHFESKVSRRLFLFYSWLRKAVPLVVESTVMKPGKVMVYPKAVYAIAEANGVDPNSFGDPFPQDELFPSWIRESTEGPAFIHDGRFFSVSPGIPFNDVINDYGSSPRGALRTALGSTTPALKIPIELAGGGNGAVAQDIRTGAPKMDTSDYIDQQIPGVNVVANLTNRSPSSGFTQNTGESIGMTPEQIAKANEKNTPGPDTLALLNWLTGAGLMDLSKPSYKRQAQIEQSRSGR